MSHPFGGDGKGHPISPALRQALRSADAQHRASLEALRDAVCEYVDDLRDRGVASGDIAAAIRQRVTDLRSSGEMTGPGILADGLVDEMVNSCLEPAE
ncbi:MAG TPA: hypothetical protein VJ802_03775 [Gemmatimonadaceae bacterium]|nr:hypothetical protein [Gemmatimonadaceae bacterium]